MISFILNEINFQTNSNFNPPINKSKRPFFHNYYKNKRKIGMESLETYNKAPLSYGNDANPMLKYEKGEIKAMDLFSRKQLEDENFGKRHMNLGRRLKL